MKKQYPNQTAKQGLWAKLGPEARRMRREPTEAEARLWEILKNGKLGVKFRRQHAIDRFIVDFISLAAKLVIEVDGPIHETQPEQDQVRDAVLVGAGYRVIRFTNEQVLSDTRQVIDDIKRHLAEYS